MKVHTIFCPVQYKEKNDRNQNRYSRHGIDPTDVCIRKLHKRTVRRICKLVGYKQDHRIIQISCSHRRNHCVNIQINIDACVDQAADHADHNCCHQSKKNIVLHQLTGNIRCQCQNIFLGNIDRTFSTRYNDHLCNTEKHGEYTQF